MTDKDKRMRVGVELDAIIVSLIIGTLIHSILIIPMTIWHGWRGHYSIDYTGIQSLKTLSLIGCQKVSSDSFNERM